MEQEKNNTEVKSDKSRREWIVVSLVGSPVICLLITALACFSTLVLLQGVGPATDPNIYQFNIVLPSIVALFSIIVLFVCAFAGWIAYRKEQIKLASAISLIIFLLPVFFCAIGCVAFFVIPSFGFLSH